MRNKGPVFSVYSITIIAILSLTLYASIDKIDSLEVNLEVFEKVKKLCESIHQKKCHYTQTREDLK